MRILVKGGVFKNTDTRLPARGLPADGPQSYRAPDAPAGAVRVRSRLRARCSAC